MKTKLHFGVLVILLAFLGTYLEQTTVPNQQIVIQFSEENITSYAAENAIEVIQNKLESIGVEHLEIGQTEDGQLKITYYSDTDVAYIQSILSKEEGLKFAFKSEENKSTNSPENRNIKDYELNISEIQNTNHINWDFERTEVVELNQKSDHSHNLKVNSSADHIDAKQSNKLISVALQVNYSATLEIDNLSYKIPEVRAGPSAEGII
jgi:preprotein translocase subunit SecD